MSFKVDMHVHSYLSDGTKSPFEILELAKNLNLSGLSITDHDTIEAYTPELFELANKLEIILIPGVEISSESFAQGVHILGYNFDIDNSSFRDFLKKVQEKRHQRNLMILKNLSNKKMPITVDELFDFAKKTLGVSQTTVGRPHIAQLMVEKGYTKTIQDSFDLYLNDKGSCFVQGFKFPSKTVIEEIHKANGIASIAHPNIIKNPKVISKLIEEKVDAIEVYYAKLYLHIEERYKRIAEKNSLLITAGSDYHGDIKPFISLGCSWVDKEAFNKIISKKKLI